MNPLAQTAWFPVVMLCASNVFMTFAWYGHLKYKSAPLWMAILASWGIAFLEYLIQVPANRWGSVSFSPYQLKILQEVITVVVFMVFAFFYLQTRPQWNHVAALLCIIAAVAFGFLPSR
ncbi:MAG: DMT family protein [Verrucomicrobiales bacterium]|nr:DMT family protein [Verrucomicrobiales bacterium]